MPSRQPRQDRFWRHVDKSGDCWLWTGARTCYGYGAFFKTRQKPSIASRIAYELTHGTIPSGLCVLHICDVRLCVNPAHLTLGTKSENTADRDRKGRVSHGESHPNAKLSTYEVKELRALVAKGYTVNSLSRVFGIASSTAYNIAANHSRKDG